MKKLLSIVLAMVMLAATATTAFALENRTTYTENGTTVTESSVEIPCIEVSGIIVSANKQKTMLINGNHAYWRVEK